MKNKYAKLQDCTCAMVRKTSRLISQFYDEELSKAGINASQFNVLGVLANMDCVSVSELSKILSIERTGLTRNLRVLHKHQWIDFESAEDKRVKLIKLSALGKIVLDQALPYWTKAQKRLNKEVDETKTVEAYAVALKNLLK